MCTRGIFQMKKLNIWLCDQAGSSLGIRKFVQSDEFKKFVEENKQIECNVIYRRNRHPFLQSTYINGYQKDISLRNEQDFQEIMRKLNYLRSSDGSKPLEYAGKRVSTAKFSIQGRWRENMWDQFPKHEMERFDRIEYPEFPTIRVPILKPGEIEQREGDPTKYLLKKKRYFIDKY